MRILPISDIHGNAFVFDYILRNYDKNDYDLVTISGDVWEGVSTAFASTIRSFQRKIKKPIVMIQGNHDYWDNSIFKKDKDIYLLHNEYIELNGKLFYGSPYSPKFCNWNWMENEEDLYRLWSVSMPDVIDICLVHGPPHGYCDNVNQSSYGNNENSKLGSKALDQILYKKKISTLIVGHIHSADKFKVHPSGTNVYNVSCLDEQYKFLGFNPAPKIIEVF